jgi:hypothetical protein
MQKGLHELLELTPEQISRIADTRIEMRKKLVPLRADLELAQIELHEMIRNEASANVLDKKIDEIGTIKSEMQKIRIRHKLQFRDVLTDEQKKKLESMPGHGFGMGPGHGGRCDGCRGHGRGSGHGGHPFFGNDESFGPGPHFEGCPRMSADGI